MKKKFVFPDTIIIVSVILLIFVALTWIIPAGEFQRANIYRIDSKTFLDKADLELFSNTNEVPVSFLGKEALKESIDKTFGEKYWQDNSEVLLERSRYQKNAVVPETYRKVEAQPQNLWSFLTAPIKGFSHAALIIAFVFLVGGAFGIINKTGSIESAIIRLVQFSKDYPNFKEIIIPFMMIIFSLAGATFGMSEEVLVFIMVTIPLARALGYDSIVGVAIPFIGAGAGFAGAFANPFTVGIAQGIANVDIFSGMGYRLVVWVIFTAIAIAFVLRYMYLLDRKKVTPFNPGIEEHSEELITDFNRKHKLVLIILALAIIMLVVGVVEWGWYIEEISGLFVGAGILSAIAFRLAPNDAVAGFISGAKEMMTAALVIALTNGLLQIATDGKIIDTILHTLTGSAKDLPNAISVQIMFAFQGILNFFMPSGSGQAALTMPIMAPLSDLLGISRQTAVLAFQLGDGLFNMIIPTSGVTMGILSIAKIPYDKWFKWAIPLMVIFFIAGMLVLLPPVLGWVNF